MNCRDRIEFPFMCNNVSLGLSYRGLLLLTLRKSTDLVTHETKRNAKSVTAINFMAFFSECP